MPAANNALSTLGREKSYSSGIVFVFEDEYSYVFRLHTNNTLLYYIYLALHTYKYIYYAFFKIYIGALMFEDRYTLAISLHL